MKKIVSYVIIFTLLLVTVTAVQQGHPFNEIWRDGSGGFNFTRDGNRSNITGVNFLDSTWVFTNMFQMPFHNPGEGKVLTSDADGVGTWRDISGLNGTSKWEINETTGHIYRLNDNVGIGINSPNHKLHVIGNISGSAFCIGDDCIEEWASGGESLWTKSNDNIFYNVGNVGINTINPTKELEVNGTIKTNKIISDKFCFTENHCILRKEGILYQDLSGINNSMPKEGLYYEILYQN